MTVGELIQSLEALGDTTLQVVLEVGDDADNARQATVVEDPDFGRWLVLTSDAPTRTRK